MDITESELVAAAFPSSSCYLCTTTPQGRVFFFLQCHRKNKWKKKRRRWRRLRMNALFPQGMKDSPSSPFPSSRIIGGKNSADKHQEFPNSTLRSTNEETERSCTVVVTAPFTLSVGCGRRRRRNWALSVAAADITCAFSNPPPPPPPPPCCSTQH